MLTWHGTVVCRDLTQDALVHRPLAGPFDDVVPLSIGAVTPALQADLGNLLRNDFDALRLEMPGTPLADWTISRAPDHRALRLARGDECLTALLPGDSVSLCSGGTGPWASFLAVDETDLAALRDILAATWLVQSTGEAARPEPASMAAGFQLLIGMVAFDLRWNLPFDLAAFPHRLPLLRDGWRIDRIDRYRPLIYYTAFDSPAIMRQFAASLHSLVTAGAYSGDVAVLTDKTDAEIQALVPPAMPGSVVVLHCDAADRIAYLAARLAISGWRDAWDFQPLLYVDTDILFDLEVAPMLHRIAGSDRIAAPVEPSERLDRSVFVGCGLLMEDNCAPGPILGFNAGTLGIPNLRQHAATLELIGRIMRNRASLFGREALPYVDQAIANYVSFRIANVDTALISPYVRLAAAGIGASGKRGLVHFCWMSGSAERAAAMQAYLTELGRPLADSLL